MDCLANATVVHAVVTTTGTAIASWFMPPPDARARGPDEYARHRRQARRRPMTFMTQPPSALAIISDRSSPRPRPRHESPSARCARPAARSAERQPYARTLLANQPAP